MDVQYILYRKSYNPNSNGCDLEIFGLSKNSAAESMTSRQIQCQGCLEQLMMSRRIQCQGDIELMFTYGLNLIVIQ